MMVIFRSKAHADILMFGDIAIQLLKLMGHSGTVPGALLAEDVAEALAHLKKTVAMKNPASADVSNNVQDENSDERTVDLAHRALPLIELLSSAVTTKCDVMWD